MTPNYCIRSRSSIFSDSFEDSLLTLLEQKWKSNVYRRHESFWIQKISLSFERRWEGMLNNLPDCCVPSIVHLFQFCRSNFHKNGGFKNETMETIDFFQETTSLSVLFLWAVGFCIKRSTAAQLKFLSVQRKLSVCDDLVFSLSSRCELRDENKE